MEVKATKVDNGWILQVTKRDILTGQPEVSITVHPTVEDVIAKIKDSGNVY